MASSEAPRDAIARAELARSVADILDHSGMPLSLAAIRSRLDKPKPSPRELTAFFRGNPMFHRWYGRTAKYWKYEPLAWTRARLLDLAAQEPVTAEQLIENAGPLVFGVPPSRIARVLVELKRDGRLYSFRQNARIYVFGAPSDTGVLMRRFLEAREREARQVLATALAAAGLPVPAHRPVKPRVGAEPELSRLPISDRMEDLVLQALVQLEHGPGLPVTARKLRRHPLLAGVDRSHVDAAVLVLRSEGKVILHGETTSLYVVNENERADLVIDPRGKYFVEVARNV